MSFLIRVAFWLSIVILLLPTGTAPQDPATPRVGAVDALSAAGAAVSDFGQFCTRQPDACAIGSRALAAFGQKAQASARWVYEVFAERVASPSGASQTAEGEPAPVRPTGRVAPAQPQPRPAMPAHAATGTHQNTLTQADRSLPWRGPPPRPTQPVQQARHGP